MVPVKSQGVSSFCRFWLLEVTGYHSLLRFFRSDTWSLLGLQEQWSRWVLAQNETVMVGQRVVLSGDHTQVPKDGTRMPGVVTLHQDSETQSKPSYFRGQYWGAIGLLIGKLNLLFVCLWHYRFIKVERKLKKILLLKSLAQLWESVWSLWLWNGLCSINGRESLC